MKWVDILKETVTQSRVKEIEDINIDIDEDDCLRWFNRLTQILTRHPETEEQAIMERSKRIENEEDACAVKEAWESPLKYEYRKGRIFVMNQNAYDKPVAVGISVTNREKTDDDNSFLTRPKGWRREVATNNDPYVITLGAVITKASNAKDFPRLELVFTSKDLSKTKRVLKQLCDYLNVNYNNLLEGLE
tara:strand:- start:3561 stop:4130 length:570 start_codon:yes stop_codon:yes gene_type:complete